MKFYRVLEAHYAANYASSFFLCEYEQAKKNVTSMKPSWLNKLGQYRGVIIIYYNYYVAFITSEQDSSILPFQSANQRAAFDSSCMLTELAVY